MKLDSAIEEFNGKRDTKTKLVDQDEKSIVIEMKGKSEAEIEKDMYALRAQLEQVIDDSVLVQSIRKSGSTFTIKFSIEKSPAEDILEILKCYDEGTESRKFIPEE